MEDLTTTGIPVRLQGVDFETDIQDSNLPDALFDKADSWIKLLRRFHAEREAQGGSSTILGRRAPIHVPNYGLLLSGAPGVGKSWLAASLANEVARLFGAKAVHWVSAQNLASAFFRKMELSDIIRKLSTIDDDTPELIEKRARDQHLWAMRNEIPVLVIDDLGRERESGSGFVSGILDEMIRTRIDNGLCTHITTNLSISKGHVAGRYGEPLESLLKEAADAYELFDAPDYRKTINAERGS